MVSWLLIRALLHCTSFQHLNFASLPQIYACKGAVSFCFTRGLRSGLSCAGYILPSQTTTNTAGTLCGSSNAIGGIIDSCCRGNKNSASSRQSKHSSKYLTLFVRAEAEIKPTPPCPEARSSRHANYVPYVQPPATISASSTSLPSNHYRRTARHFFKKKTPAGQARRPVCGGAPLPSPTRTPWPPMLYWPPVEPWRRWRRPLAQPRPPRSYP